MAKLKEQDIKEALKLTSNSATKKLVLAGVKGSDDFPSLLKDYKWSVAKPYDMALIIIAYYAYCVKSEDPTLKNFGKTSKQKGHDSFKLLNNLKRGDGQRIKSLIQRCLEKPLNEILEMVIPGEENMLERSKIIANFVKQAKKITPSGFDLSQNEMIEVLVNTITESKEELKKELEKVKSDFTPGKKEAAKNAANTVPLKRQLESALLRGHETTVRQIIESNPNLSNALLNERHETPLYYAAGSGHQGIVNLLLNHGADPNIQHYLGETPLHYAAESGHQGIVNLLLNHGADPNIQDRIFLETPLHVAAGGGHGEIIELLLQHNADPNIRNNDGETLLHVAARNGHGEIIELLLQHNADPNAQNNNGETPLHIAAHNERLDIVNLLLDRGADPNIRDNRGRTYQDLLPRQPRRLQVADFPQDEFRHSLANGETIECPICLDEFGANDLCCIFNCQHSEDYPFGHYLCNECAQELLKDNGESAKCPTCRAGLKPHN